MAEALKLPLRLLGSTGIQVSTLGLGTVKFGRNVGVKNKVPDGFTLPSDKELEALFDICLEHGLNFLDTAPAYGNSEERIGKLLKARRSSFVISTKAGEEFDGVNSKYDFSAQAIRQSVERSLQRLRADLIDCVLLHLPRNDLEVLTSTPALEELSKLKREGKIRAFGASTHSIAGGEYVVKNSDLVMLPFNPSYREHQPVIELAAKLNKGVTIKKGLFSGHLDPNDPTKSVEYCLKSALAFPAVSSVIVGTINAEHLRENVEACCGV
jgi:aryl-alcohol dehydrogenase-like predicted oxidoreductase